MLCFIILFRKQHRYNFPFLHLSERKLWEGYSLLHLLLIIGLNTITSQSYLYLRQRNGVTFLIAYMVYIISPCISFGSFPVGAPVLCWISVQILAQSSRSAYNKHLRAPPETINACCLKIKDRDVFSTSPYSSNANNSIEVVNVHMHKHSEQSCQDLSTEL